MYIRCTGIYVRCTLDTLEMYMGCTWDVHGMYMGCTWDVHAMYMRCTWDVHGMYIRFTWDVHGMSGKAVGRLCAIATVRQSLYDGFHQFPPVSTDFQKAPSGGISPSHTHGAMGPGPRGVSSPGYQCVTAVGMALLCTAIWLVVGATVKKSVDGKHVAGVCLGLHQWSPTSLRVQ